MSPERESNDAVLARIDERLKNIDSKISDLNDKHNSYNISLKEHFEDDKNNFSGLYKNQYIGYGILIAINFFVILFKH